MSAYQQAQITTLVVKLRDGHFLAWNIGCHEVKLIVFLLKLPIQLDKAAAFLWFASVKHGLVVGNYRLD